MLLEQFTGAAAHPDLYVHKHSFANNLNFVCKFRNMYSNYMLQTPCKFKP